MLGRKEKERKNPEKDRQRNIGRQKEAKIGKIWDKRWSRQRKGYKKEK